MINKPIRILAIDDNPDNLVTLKAIIGNALPEATVITALRGEKGIELAMAEDPDVILLDIFMPGMDGIDVCRRLKEEGSTVHIPIIMLTAQNTDQTLRFKTLEAGADCFLTKPVDDVDLVAMIRVMVKIREARMAERQEKEHLSALVLERTREIEKELAERKKTEMELVIAKEKAEEGDRLKSAFLANMSHEIRTPMNGIVGFSELLSDPDLEPESRDHYVRIINDNCQQLLHIVSDIIDISKIEAGVIELNEGDFCLNELMDSVFNNHLSKTNAKGLQLTVHKGLVCNDCSIWGDSSKIRQVLENLLTNALKFTAQGEIKYGYDKVDNRLRFFVYDTGIGIAQEHLQSIFNRFWQVEKGLARQYGGTGIGLSISKAFIEKMGGEIEVISSLGKGAQFIFEIPYIPAKEVHNYTPLEKIPQKILKGKTILVVEDEAFNYEFLEIILSRLDLNLLHAWNGGEAMQVFTNHPETDLVLMDFKLPDIPGQEITRRMVAMRNSVPVIATTAYAMSGDREKATQAGCVDYLAKPFRPAELVGMLEKYLKYD